MSMYKFESSIFLSRLTSDLPPSCNGGGRKRRDALTNDSQRGEPVEKPGTFWVFIDE